jgi:hypothetical protein
MAVNDLEERRAEHRAVIRKCLGQIAQLNARVDRMNDAGLDEISADEKGAVLDLADDLTASVAQLEACSSIPELILLAEYAVSNSTHFIASSSSDEREVMAADLRNYLSEFGVYARPQLFVPPEPLPQGYEYPPRMKPFEIFPKRLSKL